MKRQVAIALCVLTMCSLCIFELILVTISIRQHVLYDRATCVSEGGGALCQMLGALIVFVRFSFFRLLERIGFCYFGKSDSCDNSERLGNAELSCALYGALLNLINPLSVVCVVGIFDASYMHYFWMITPLWICGVVLLGKKRRMEGLQLTAGKSADRSWAAHQSMIDCFARCRSLSGIDLLAILLTAVLAMLVGYIAHEGALGGLWNAAVAGALGTIIGAILFILLATFGGSFVGLFGGLTGFTFSGLASLTAVVMDLIYYSIVMGITGAIGGAIASKE